MKFRFQVTHGVTEVVDAGILLLRNPLDGHSKFFHLARMGQYTMFQLLDRRDDHRSRRLQSRLQPYDPVLDRIHPVQEWRQIGKFLRTGGGRRGILTYSHSECDRQTSSESQSQTFNKRVRHVFNFFPSSFSGDLRTL